MTTRHAKHKSPDAHAPPSPPALKAPKSDSDEIAKLKAQIERLKAVFKFHTGYTVDDDGNVKPITRKP